MATPILNENSAAAPDMVGVNRAVAYMSDGTVIAVVHRSGTGVRIYDNHTGTFNSYMPFSDDIASGKYLSLTIDADDNLHLVYTSVSENVRYVKFTYDGDHEWTAGASELVRTRPGTSSIGRKDVEVLDDGAIVVAWLESDNASSSKVPTFRVRVRHTGGAWGATTVVTEATAGSVTTARCCTIARDGDEADGGYQRVAYAYSMPNSVGGKFGHLRVKLDDGSISENTPIGTFGQQGLGSYGHLYSHGDGEWTFVGQQNHALGTNLCQTIYFRWKYGTGYVEQASPLAQLDATWPNATSTFPTTALVGDQAVILTTFTVNGRAAIVARVYHPGVGWGPQFNLAEGSATSATSGVGTEYLRSSANRNVPADRIFVAATLARVDLDTNVARAHYVHTNPAPAAPTNLGPGEIEIISDPPTVGTSEPVLSARTASVASGATRRRIQWLIDTTTLYTTDPKTYTQPVSALQFAGATHTLTVPQSNPLYTDVFFIKARALDEFGRPGAYSGNWTFSVYHPPASADWTPDNGRLAAYGDGNVLLSWRFTDPYPRDFQGAYRIAVYLESDGTVILDTGMVVSTDTEVTVNIDAAYKDEVLQWRVDLWDVDGSLSPNVTYHLFTLGDEPAVTIDAPVDASTLDNPMLNVEWSAVFGGARTQAAYRVDVQDTTTSTLAHSSGWINGENTAYTVPGSALTNEHDYIVVVTLRDSGGLVGSAQSTFDTSWIPPAAPSFTIDTSFFAEQGFIRIEWDDDAKDEDFSTWAITARMLDRPVLNQDIVRIPVGSVNSFDWVIVGPIEPWEIDVRQVVDRFGVEVQSEPDPETITVETPYYWLCPITFVSIPTADQLIKLHGVVEDNPSEDQDYETHKLIGRGNKDDLGTHWGWSSSLSCQLRDRPGLSARDQKERIIGARMSGTAHMLRNPFGDIALVNLGLISYNHIPGTGNSELVDLTLPYHSVELGLEF